MARAASVRVDAKLLEVVDAIARSRGQKRSEAVREALESWVTQRRTAERVRAHAAGYANHPVGTGEFGPMLGAQFAG